MYVNSPFQDFFSSQIAAEIEYVNLRFFAHLLLNEGG